MINRAVNHGHLGRRMSGGASIGVVCQWKMQRESEASNGSLLRPALPATPASAKPKYAHQPVLSAIDVLHYPRRHHPPGLEWLASSSISTTA